MMHPGTPTLPALKYKVPGFIDVIKTDLNTNQRLLALAWDYASIDKSIVDSVGTYEIDITISSTSSAPKDLTFVFARGDDPLKSTFSIREI